MEKKNCDMGERTERRRLAGTILKLERLKQGKGQKEICYGICVPSYLSKIEHGTVSADEEILSKLSVEEI